MSEFIKKAYEANKVKNIEDAFMEYPTEEEWHKGKIEYFINDKNFYYGDKCEIGDIVFVREYNYSNGSKGYNHLFVIVDSNYQAVPIEYFGMIISSKIDKLKYNTNMFLEKNSKNSIVKTDVIYKLLREQIVFKIGSVDIEEIEKYKKCFNEEINEKKEI